MVLLSDEFLKKKKALEWALVLDAMSVHYTLSETGDGWQISVEEKDLSYALEQIGLYETENHSSPDQSSSLLMEKQSGYAILVPFALYLFYLATILSEQYFAWVDKGTASAEAILKGEWWRAVTALTLHADIAHLFSNLLFGSITATLLIRQIGGGAAWFIILLSGIAGDLLNSWMFEKNHYSIGASTAVFGIVGILSALQFFKNHRVKKWRAWIPFASGLGLLAFLGTEGKNTDVTAHFFGFVSGVFLGLIAGFWFRKREIKALGQIIFGLAAFIIVVFSWCLALR